MVTDGGTMRLVFATAPEPGELWGLRWAGNNHSNDVQALVAAGALSWDDTALRVPVGIVTNATHTMVGCTIPQYLGTVFEFR